MAERSWYQRNREKALADMRARRATPEGRRKRQSESRKYREKHKQKINAWQRDYYHRSSDRRNACKAQASTWVKLNKQRRRQWIRRYWKANGDRLRAENKVYRATPAYQTRRKNYEARPEVRAAMRRLRRTWWPLHYRKHKERLLAQMRPHRLKYMTQRKTRMRTPVEEAEAIKQFIVQTLQLPEVMCAYCGLPAKKREFDHAIPLSRGGQHVLANIRVACAFCNRSKANKTPEEFMQYRQEVGI